MRKLMLWVGLVALVAVARAEDFTKSITAEERAAAGLDRLTPGELEKLKAIVERYKTGEVAVVQKVAEQKVAVAEAKVKAVEAKAAVVAEPEDKKKPGWMRALITLDKAGKDSDKNDVFESRIAGDFKGWRKGTVFNLENGQRWQHESGEDYVTPPSKAPKVKIYPGVLGTFWMEIEGVRPRVRVKPLRLN